MFYPKKQLLKQSEGGKDQAISVEIMQRKSRLLENYVRLKPLVFHLGIVQFIKKKFVA